ncbi:MAG: excinuclease ABC subunit UvrB [Bacteroidales bacterium]|nr:excinuclease ABC subunit UvrB [Bacteroidales bacterium]
MQFKLKSNYKPTGDQPQAIDELIKGIEAGERFQILQGVTGSGKTFTIANLIEKINRPVLVLSHNKTLAAQLYGEFMSYFPENAVEYFVSYYDYYQPEAYIPSSNTYIEKDLTINEEIEKLRLSTTTSLLTSRRDVIVVSSVSCLYGIGNPEDFYSNLVEVKKGANLVRNKFLRDLVSSLYSRNDLNFSRGNFRVTGDTVDVFPAYSDIAIRISFWGDEVDEILTFDPVNGHTIDNLDFIRIYPASIFMTTKERLNQGVDQIVLDMGKQVGYFKETGKNLEAKRIEDRVTYDVEMIKELGYCTGIENYSRYFDGRKSGSRPFCLLDYFPEDFIVVIDESHVTLPQVHAMYGGDRSRKRNLVEYGFRLPAAMDNRPLKFEEFEGFEKQTIYLSATPANYELEKCEGVVVEQVIRPTGLIDPGIDVRSSLNQIDDLVAEINTRANIDERVLVTTLTKRMAEELSEYFDKISIRSRYIHSDVETVERVQIMEDLRRGIFDVLIGVNLLREGLDLPEVSLVAILDADKEGFLRSERSLTQTAGRAARNINGKVIMYADKITKSMQRTIDETDRRREKQLKYNEENNITPRQIQKEIGKIKLTDTQNEHTGKIYNTGIKSSIAADPVVKYMTKSALEKAIQNTEKKMLKAAEELNFTEAARFRDEIVELKGLLKNS